VSAAECIRYLVAAVSGRRGGAGALSRGCDDLLPMRRWSCRSPLADPPGTHDPPHCSISSDAMCCRAQSVIRAAAAPTDRRARLVMLTERGKRIRPLAMATGQRVEEGWGKRLGQQRLEALAPPFRKSSKFPGTAEASRQPAKASEATAGAKGQTLMPARVIVTKLASGTGDHCGPSRSNGSETRQRPDPPRNSPA
jgi:hypothetical protein